MLGVDSLGDEINDASIGLLSETDQEIIRLIYWDGVTQRQAAQILKTPEARSAADATGPEKLCAACWQRLNSRSPGERALIGMCELIAAVANEGSRLNTDLRAGAP